MTLRAPHLLMRRTNRLASAGQIRHVYETGRRATAASVGCVGLVAADGPPRIAVVAGRKLGGAVARNRAKRRLRAALDPLVARMPEGAHVVVGATAQTNEVSFQKLTADLERLFGKIGVLTSA